MARRVAGRKITFDSGNRRSRWPWITGVAVVILLVAGELWWWTSQPEPEPEPSTVPTETVLEVDEDGIIIPNPTEAKIACDRSGGDLRTTPEGTTACASRLDDAGTECTDSSECIGQCIALEDSEETGIGACQELSVLSGSPPTVSKGEVLKTILE
ncbi:MAG: hypothetical protein KC925_02670 [Candidatus Doudnabacteria bacterium]|nr:hypothetical protein [Candidatus Doudnabacteria bacterium]